MDRRQILIVEDSPTMRQLLVFALRRLKDVEISEAQDGMDGSIYVAVEMGGFIDSSFAGRAADSGTASGDEDNLAIEI